MEFGGLDPAHYIGMPALSYDIYLKMTGTQIEQMTELDMVRFTESSIRGGHSYTSCRYAKEEIVPEGVSTHILYLVSLNTTSTLKCNLI